MWVHVDDVAPPGEAAQHVVEVEIGAVTRPELLDDGAYRREIIRAIHREAQRGQVRERRVVGAPQAGRLAAHPQRDVLALGGLAGLGVRARERGACADFHVHAVGKCEPPLESAGPHFNPSNTKHGVAVGPGHAGDLPNLYMPDTGGVHVEFFAPELSIREGVTSVLDADGAALVVHADRDDHKTDPAGSSGDRIACDVIER